MWPPTSAGGVQAEARHPHYACDRLLSDDLAPGELAHENYFFVDLVLRRLFTEDTTQVFDFRRDQLVVLGEKADGGGLEISLGNTDQLGRSLDLDHLVHVNGNHE